MAKTRLNAHVRERLRNFAKLNVTAPKEQKVLDAHTPRRRSCCCP